MTTREDTYSPEFHAVFVDTNLDTPLCIVAHIHETISDFREKVYKQHQSCYPEVGDMSISALDVKLGGCFYRLSDSLNINKVFEGFNTRKWFLYATLVKEVVEKKTQKRKMGKVQGGVAMTDSFAVSPRDKGHDILAGTVVKGEESRLAPSAVDNLQTAQLVTYQENQLEASSGLTIGPSTKKTRRRKKSSKDDINQSTATAPAPGNVDYVDTTYESCPILRRETLGNPLAKAIQKEHETGEKMDDDAGSGKAIASAAGNIQTDNFVSYLENQLGASRGLITSTPTEKKTRRNKSSKNHMNKSKKVSDHVDSTCEAILNSRGEKLDVILKLDHQGLEKGHLVMIDQEKELAPALEHVDGHVTSTTESREGCADVLVGVASEHCDTLPRDDLLSMSRNKNKRQTPSNDDVDFSQILRKIHGANDVSDDDIDQLFMIWKPICQGCRVNKRDNPNCFCGLVPPISGSRKDGLWQKTSDFIKSLGPNLSLDLRASDSTPAGLTNLGATCYANSILQCLYMNTTFREGLFSVEDHVLKQYPVLKQIGRLFADLHASKKSFVDTDAFVKTLDLDDEAQQDPQEFLSLLLSLLERCLLHSGICNAKTLVQDLFRGSLSHVTTCSKCGRESEASSKVEDFYALELNIKGLKTLDASLNDYLSLEQLNEDNQYFCGRCNARVDATLCIKLRTLPPVVTFHLKRCVFVPQAAAKKKITCSFSFPQVLDMGSRLGESCQNELPYDLSAVIIHKGTVDSGHYVAHIKDVKTGSWWKFDDKHVSQLGKRPFNEGSVSEVYSSSDAYMLMYSLRSGNPTSITKGEVKQLEGGYLPSHLDEWINKTNALFVERCKKYNSRKERELNALTERRQQVRTILSEAAVQSLEEEFCWISTDWLRQWTNTILPPDLDNTPLLCTHGKVPASMVNCMKRISELAWAKLKSKLNGGPKLGKGDCCRDCLMDSARMVVSSDSYRDERTRMQSIASNVLSGNCDDGKYYISKVWLQQWVRRKSLDAPGKADAGPTYAITCSHGALMPESKRILVPEDLWLFISSDAIKAMPGDTWGCRCFPSDSSDCCHCTGEPSEDSLRSTLKAKQRQNHEKLATGNDIPLMPQGRYFLLPSPWLVKWRSYINMTGKNTSSAPEPELLDGVINSLKCNKHTRLFEKLPELVCRGGSFFQKKPYSDKLTIIPEHDWNFFCAEWEGNTEKGVSVLIEIGNNAEQSSSPDVDAQQLILRTSPEICEECIGERESCELVQKFSKSEGYVSVYLERGKEAPKSLEVDLRTSKRTRRAKNGDEATLKVSGTTTVYQLKTMIWKTLGVMEENQLLHKGTKVIDQDSATLPDIEIFPGDRLWVREHRNIAGSQNIEKGFQGTLLTGDISSEARKK